jgi:hypothetical protein
MPEGTLGKDIGECLDKNSLRLVPKYESHDLKHVLLDFKMTPVDEIRLQAFMLGNGNYSIPSFAIFIFGALFLPDLWPTFYKDFKNGRNAMPISSWTIEEYAQYDTSRLREIIFNYSTSSHNSFSMKSLAKFGAYTAIVLGTFGMIFCFPYLFSSSLADLVGAGFPFLGGAVIASAGLITLSNLVKKDSRIAEAVMASLDS